MKQLRIVHVLTFVLILTVAIGCAKKEETATEVSFSSSGAPAPPPSETAAAGETTAQSAADMMLARSLSDEIVAILSKGARIETVSGGTRTVLTVESNDTGKRKYYEPSGAQLVEVKSSDDGFKVRTPDGKLLWKVKIYDDKIKVSDNEENLDAWVVKTTYPEKAKVLDPAGSDFGEVHYAPAPDPVRLSDRSGTDVWTVSGTTGSGAWGAILMEHITLEQRAIITAELLSRRR